MESTTKVLHKILNGGGTIYSIIRSVAPSGMSRRIDFYFFTRDNTGRLYKAFLTGLIADLLGYSYTSKNWHNQDGLLVKGCGFDAAWDVVNNLNYALYGDNKDLYLSQEPL